jgi:tetratricopeptide (TPR) repeat protein
MSGPQLSENGAAVEAVVAQGLALHQAGRLDEARPYYDLALEVDPRHFGALHMLGVLCIQTGHLDRAVELIQRAIQINPGVADAYGNLASALNSLGRHDEALASCDRAIGLAPDHAGAHGNRGAALHQLGRLEEALASYQRQAALRPSDARAPFNQAVMLRDLGRTAEALASLDRALVLRPDYPEALRSRGLALHELGRFDEALGSYAQAVAARPDYAEAFYDQGTTYLDLRRPREAMASYDRAIALRPAHAEAHGNRGAALNALGAFEDALESFDRALALRPDYAKAYCNRMIALQGLGRPEDALESCEQALALEPNYAEAHHNRASALYGLRRLEEALESCDLALALKPDFAEAQDSRGVALSELGRFDEALESYGRALALKPDYAEAHHNMAMCRLRLGDDPQNWKTGWAQYEQRWGTRQFAAMRRDFDAPLWLGVEDIRGRTILLHAEQGLGDTLQFCRYAPAVAALGARVVLEVDPGLEQLLSRLDGVDQIVTRGGAAPAHDYQTPLMSLPLALGAGPQGDAYLSANPAQAATWAARLGERRGLRIGLCWAGGTRPGIAVADAIDKRRSLPLEAFAPLAQVPGLEIYSLQKGPPAAQLAQAQARDWGGPAIADPTGDLKSFADTAALVANLDLVITCDTSTAHLAGGMGKPVWILNRFDACWRWLDGRDDSPWYPSARLFKQTTPGDWDGVVEGVTRGLLELRG